MRNTATGMENQRPEKLAISPSASGRLIDGYVVLFFRSARFCPAVAMIKTADARLRLDPALSGQASLDQPIARCESRSCRESRRRRPIVICVCDFAVTQIRFSLIQ